MAMVSSSRCLVLNHQFFESVCLRSIASVRPFKSIVFVLGPPGSGKGTVCEDIVKEFNFKHLSAGHLLREEQKNTNSRYSAMIQDCISSGSIVPSHITCDLLERALNRIGDQKVLIDGFPRSMENMHAWSKRACDSSSVKYVLFLECPEQVCSERCMKRGLVDGRSDDNEETLRKRFQVYVQNTIPVVKHFEKDGTLLRVQSDRKREEVSLAVAKLLEEVGFRRQRTTEERVN